MISLVNVWKDRAISITTKKRFLKSLALNIAPYGLQCWVPKATDKMKINSFELWCYQRLLQNMWTDKKTNEFVLSKIGASAILLTTIVKQKMAFVGDVLRKGDICTDLLIGAVYGKRKS